jgi:hypothetical protein
MSANGFGGIIPSLHRITVSLIVIGFDHFTVDEHFNLVARK